MPMTRYASLEVAEILEVKGTEERAKTASLDRVSDFHDYRTEDGYLYARIRAISSRVNRNNDAWPSIELAGGPEIFERHAKTASPGFTVEASDSSIPKDAKGRPKFGFATFLGKPIFVDHNNTDPKKSRGAIVDAKLHVEDHRTASDLDPYYSTAPDNHKPPTWIELLLEIDAKTYPKFAQAILEGSEDANKGIDGFSMGCNVDHTVCSHCENKAESPDQFCEHVKLKGAQFKHPKTGKMAKSYEDCYGVQFFEISGVFEPADETALIREVRASVYKEAEVPQVPLVRGMKCPHCSGLGEQGGVACPTCQGTGEIRVGEGNDGAYVLDHDQGAIGSEYGFPGEDPHFEGPTIHVDAEHPGTLVAPNLTLNPNKLKRRNLGPVRQGKTADNATPQSELTKAPEEVDTLREEKICPFCGSHFDGASCEVCGYVEPPDGMNTPNLEPPDDPEVDPRSVDKLQQTEEVVSDEPSGIPTEGDNSDVPESYLRARNKHNTSSVTSDMAWKASGTQLTSGKINQIEKPVLAGNPPVSNEPNETVVSDSSGPVTSRTAGDLIEAANKGTTMAERVAAEPADQSGKAQKQVDVEGVGGVIDDTNEQASKPDGAQSYENAGTQTDVTGKGGIIEDSNAEASKPSDGTVDVDKAVRTDDSGPTKTWDNSNEPGSAVTDKSFPTSSVEAAKQGVKPLGPSDVQPSKRVDLEQNGPTPDPIKGTQQWTGTDGNGVTRQQAPVTNKGTQSGGITSQLVAAFKLADTEVDLGLIEKSAKWDRIAQLEGESESVINARLDTLSSVKTAGLTKPQAEVTRLPSFQRAASVEETPVNIPDEAIFFRH